MRKLRRLYIFIIGPSIGTRMYIRVSTKSVQPEVNRKLTYTHTHLLTFAFIK